MALDTTYHVWICTLIAYYVSIFVILQLRSNISAGDLGDEHEFGGGVKGTTYDNVLWGVNPSKHVRRKGL